MSQRNQTNISYDNETHILSCSNEDLVNEVGKTIVFYRVVRDTSNNAIKSKEFMFAYYNVSSAYFGQFAINNWKIK